MKRQLESYSFNKLEIKTLKEIAKGNNSLYMLREALAIKPNLLSYVLKRLLQKGMVKVEKKEEGPKKYVYFDNSKHASLFRELLLKYDHIKWENILSGLAIDVLFQILDKTETTLRSFSKTTFWRYARHFMSHGIIMKTSDDSYEINPRFAILKDFLIEYQRFLMNSIVRSVSASTVILWQRDFECLIRVSKNIDVSRREFLRTATSRFNDLGIPLISDFDLYFYSKKKHVIQVEDVILHTLLIEKGNPRYTLYSLLLLKKQWRRIDKEYLLKEAQRLDLRLQIEVMLQFLETQGEKRGLMLPTWEEFLMKAEEYKVIS